MTYTLFLLQKLNLLIQSLQPWIVQSAGAIEDADWISAEG